jgi:hypothetical protein
MLLKMQVFWAVKVSLSKGLSTFRKNVLPSSSRVKRSKAGKKCGNTYARIGTGWWMVGKGFFRAGYSVWTSWPLKTMASRFFESSKTTLSAIHHHIPEDVNYKFCFALQAHPTSVTI